MGEHVDENPSFMVKCLEAAPSKRGEYEYKYEEHLSLFFGAAGAGKFCCYKQHVKRSKANK